MLLLTNVIILLCVCVSFRPCVRETPGWLNVMWWMGRLGCWFRSVGLVISMTLKLGRDRSDSVARYSDSRVG